MDGEEKLEKKMIARNIRVYLLSIPIMLTLGCGDGNNENHQPLGTEASAANPTISIAPGFDCDADAN